MLLDAIEKRHSVRSYSDRPVEDTVLEEVLAAAVAAPSGCNLQPWRLVVVRDRTVIRGMVHAVGGQQFVEHVPALIVACVNGEGYNVGHRYDGAVIDIAIALDHLSLQAASLGLGTCWLGNYDGNEVRALLGIPSMHPVVAIMALGYPDEKAPHHPRSHKPLKELICWERYTD